MERMTLAQAVGEGPICDGWVAGVDFDPSSVEEMEIMGDVFDKERSDSLFRLERENAWLRRELAELRGDDEDGYRLAGDRN